MTVLKIGKATGVTVLVQLVVYIAFTLLISYSLSQEDTSGKELGGLIIMMTTMSGSLLLTLTIFPLIGTTLVHLNKVNFLVFLSGIFLSNVVLAFPLWFVVGAIWWGGYFLVLGVLSVLTLPFLPIWWLVARKPLDPKVSNPRAAF